MTIRKVLVRCIKTLGVFIALIILYFLSALAFSAVTVNSAFKPCEKDAVEIYILTNGVHTDLVLPFRNQYHDWSGMVKPSHTRSLDTAARHVAFGWGDKGFYLETETWDDLKFSTAFKALFYLSSSAMHVSFYDELKESGLCRKICISKESYQKMVNYIAESFDNSTATQIGKAAYGYNDAFYEARGRYSLFFTCNTWTNDALKRAGLKACLWTPFDKGIFQKYEN